MLSVQSDSVLYFKVFRGLHIYLNLSYYARVCHKVQVSIFLFLVTSALALNHSVADTG